MTISECRLLLPGCPVPVSSSPGGKDNGWRSVSARMAWLRGRIAWGSTVPGFHPAQRSKQAVPCPAAVPRSCWYRRVHKDWDRRHQYPAEKCRRLSFLQRRIPGSRNRPSNRARLAADQHNPQESIRRASSHDRSRPPAKRLKKGTGTATLRKGNRMHASSF